MTLRYQLTFIVRDSDDADCILRTARLLRELGDNLPADGEFSEDSALKLKRTLAFHADADEDVHRSLYEIATRLSHVEFEDTVYGRAGGAIGRLPPK